MTVYGSAYVGAAWASAHLVSSPPLPPLPTTGLTAHFDASVLSTLWKTYVSGGPNTGVPANGDAVAVWESAAGYNQIFKQRAANPLPTLQSSSPLLPLQCLAFDGTLDQCMTLADDVGTAIPLSSLFTASTFTLLLSFYPEGITSTASDYTAEPLIADTDGYWGVFVSKIAGVPKLLAFNYPNYVVIDCTDNAANVAMVRHESGVLYASINGGTESSTASGNTGSMGGIPRIAFGSYGNGRYKGREGELVIYTTALSGTDLTDALGYFTQKWLP